MARKFSCRIAIGLLFYIGMAATLITTPVYAAEKPEEAVARLLERLRTEFKNGYGSDEWAGVLRELILLGPDATPVLSKALDAEDDLRMLRCYGFVMRGIGDKRAVPALIRNFPKACIPPASDLGLRCHDPELLDFMQQHDKTNGNENGKGDGGYDFGRPINEFRTALQKLTGTKLTEDELVFVDLAGTAQQQKQKRVLSERCAQKWADWWNEHGTEFVKDAEYSKVTLPPFASGANTPAVIPNLLIADGSGSPNCILQSVRNPHAKRCFKDLDTGREAGLPDHLKAAAGQPPRLDDIRAWADKEGFDLMGDEYFLPGDEKPHYVLRALGLTAWQMDAKHWKTLAADMQKKVPITLNRWTNNLLNTFDDDRGCFVPEETALFSFRTREGVYGVIFVGVEVHDDKQQPGGRSDGDDELKPIHFNKGRRYAYKMFADPAEAVAP